MKVAVEVFLVPYCAVQMFSSSLSWIILTVGKSPQLLSRSENKATSVSIFFAVDSTEECYESRIDITKLLLNLDSEADERLSWDSLHFNTEFLILCSTLSFAGLFSCLLLFATGIKTFCEEYFFMIFFISIGSSWFFILAFPCFWEAVIDFCGFDLLESKLDYLSATVFPT